MSFPSGMAGCPCTSAYRRINRTCTLPASCARHRTIDPRSTSDAVSSSSPGPRSARADAGRPLTAVELESALWHYPGDPDALLARWEAERQEKQPSASS